MKCCRCYSRTWFRAEGCARLSCRLTEATPPDYECISDFPAFVIIIKPKEQKQLCNVLRPVKCAGTLF